MAEQVQTFLLEYSLFGGLVRSINSNLGINQNSTVFTVSIVKDDGNIEVTNRQSVHISIGALDFRGIVQSWSHAKKDITGEDVYQIRITDTKPVLNSAQVIIGSSFEDDSNLTVEMTQPEDYGDNTISILPGNPSEITNGIPFNRIQTAVENSIVKYGSENYTVKFNFSLPDRGGLIEYSLRGRSLSLLELISQIGDDHGLDWFVTTSKDNVISVNMFGRTNITNKTVDELAAIHQGAIIKRHEGEENRDAIQKVVLIGGYQTRLSKLLGSSFIQFWGFDDGGDRRIEPVYSETVMERILNNDFTSDDYTEDDVQKILSYANEFWGRKFISGVGAAIIGSDNKSWVLPNSAGWWSSDTPPEDLDQDGRLKFQTEDGRWITFVALGLPGRRFDFRPDAVSYQWDDELFSNPNTHINDNNVICMKSTLEILQSPQSDDQFFLLTNATPLRVKKSQDVTTDGVTSTVITRTRADSLSYAYVSVIDQRLTYGPWINRSNSVGRTEVIIDNSLTPWSFGYRGIDNTTGIDLVNQVALAKIKTVTDTTMDAKTVELEVAGLPAINIGDQLQTTGAITSIQIVFAIGGVRTTYKSLQYTNDLSKHQRKQQDLLDRLRRQASEFNNTLIPPVNDWELDKIVRVLKSDLPDPPVDSANEGVANRRELRTLLGRIDTRSSLSEPKYNITPMAWSSDVFGELTLVRDPLVFGQYVDVVNMGEKQTAGGRLVVGTDVQVREFSVTDGGIVSYYIDVSVSDTQSFKATIEQSVSNGQPIYRVSPVVNAVQQLNLTSSELLSLNAVLNIGEPTNFKGFISVGTEVMVNWNENNDGSFTPFIEQQLNLFNPPT